jgi:4-hydroxy-3-polyprenylbenzoate decarboxylase
MKIVIGITGASGVVYATTLLKHLEVEETHLILSKNAESLIAHELELSLNDVIKMADHHYDNSDLSASISSGTVKYDAIVIIPCSTSTLSKIASGVTDNLITRVADVCLKEGRKVVLVPRETPLNTIHLQNMAKLSSLGAVILPAMPAFYTKPQKIEDIVNFIVGKVLDALGIAHELYPSWSPPAKE